MSERQPYSRVYWSIRQDPKFRGIYSNDSHLAAWLRLLIAADATWPAPADVPANAKPASVKALAECGLVDLLGDGLFTIHGLQAERGRRQEAATRGPRGDQLPPKRDPDAPSRAGVAELRRDETRVSQDEHSAREVDPEDAVFAFLAQHGAFIRPDAPLGRRLYGLMTRQTPEAVLEEAQAMAETEAIMSDRQWVLGLENGMEAIPSGRKSIDKALEEEAEARSEAKSNAIYERMTARRLDYFRNTGLWPEEWGEKPAAVLS
jgi:hypothetical protein